MPKKLGLRRIVAYAIDYIVMATWIGLLALIATSTKFGISDYGTVGSHARWLAQGQAFLVLTLPVYLYFTLSEAFGRKATFGKRALGLRVSGEPKRVAIRNVLKFLPWEIAHLAIWHSMDVPFVTTPQLWGLSLFVLSIGLSSLYLVTLFIGDGRTLYDRLSGTSVQLA